LYTWRNATKTCRPFQKSFVNKYFIYKFLLLMFEYFNLKKYVQLVFAPEFLKKLFSPKIYSTNF